MKRFTTLLSLMAVLTSCMIGEQHDTRRYPSNADGSYSFEIEIEQPEVICPTKSSFTSEELNKITDINIFVYHEGALLKDYCKYFTDMSAVHMTFPATKDGFNVYMVGNVGEIEAPEDESEISKMQYVVGSYDEFRTKGFPVANSFMNYMKGSQVNFKVKKLIGQYNVRIAPSATVAKYTVKDLRMINCALDVYPFSTDTKATVFGKTEIDKTGDLLTEEDIEKLNAGEVVPMYFIENLQGVLLPNNTDRKMKIPSIIGDDYAEKCTYIEITADVQTPAAKYTNGKYRFYLGQDETTDFSIKRNTLYNATIDFTQNMVSEEEWRIEVDEPELIGIKVDKEEAMVIKGAEDMVFVQAFDNNGNLMDFDVEVLSSSGNINVEKVETNYLGMATRGAAMGLRFTSNVDLTGYYPFDEEPTYITEIVRISSRETYNGKPIYSKDIKVRIYNKLFPLLIKLEKSSSTAYDVVVRGQNPMKLGLGITTSYTANGTAYSTDEVVLRDDIIGVNRTDRTVNMEGRVLNQIQISAPTELTLINFDIRGNNRGTNQRGVPAYPKVLKADYIFPLISAYMEGMTGPRLTDNPGKFNKISADQPWTVIFNGRPCSAFTSPCEYVSYSKSSIEVVDDVGKPTPVYYFKHKSISAVDLDRTLQDEFDNMSRFSYDANMGDPPFYVVNAGLTSHCSSLDHEKIGNWNNPATTRIQCEFFGPGRDLFYENKNGTLFNNTHILYWEIKSWTNLFDKLKTEFIGTNYWYELYMTINGNPVWAGCDSSPLGFFGKEY